MKPLHTKHKYIELLLISSRCQTTIRITRVLIFLYQTRSVSKMEHHFSNRPSLAPERYTLSGAPESARSGTGGRLSCNTSEDSGDAVGVCDSYKRMSMAPGAPFRLCSICRRLGCSATCSDLDWVSGSMDSVQCCRCCAIAPFMCRQIQLPRSRDFVPPLLRQPRVV